MAFVRSPHAHARVLGVRGAAGAVAAITAGGARVAGARRTRRPGWSVADAPHPLLARDEVRYVGQPVAAVVARRAR